MFVTTGRGVAHLTAVGQKTGLIHRRDASYARIYIYI